MNDADHALVQAALAVLQAGRLTAGTAEGDTGGLIVAWLTTEPGSSAVVIGGVAAYHDRLKRDLLGVPAEVLAQHGAVSQAAATAMAAGVRALLGVDVGLASTGIAGPTGSRPGKPVGTAWVAVDCPGGSVARQHDRGGTRAENRRASARLVLSLLIEMLEPSRGARIQ